MKPTDERTALDMHLDEILETFRAYITEGADGRVLQDAKSDIQQLYGNIKHVLEPPYSAWPMQRLLIPRNQDDKEYIEYACVEDLFRSYHMGSDGRESVDVLVERIRIIERIASLHRVFGRLNTLKEQYQREHKELTMAQLKEKVLALSE